MNRAMMFGAFAVLTMISLSAQADLQLPRNEFSPQISFYSGDATRSTFLGAASYAFRFNRLFWVGADFFAGEASVDSPNGLSLRPTERFTGVDGAIYFNLPALLGAFIKGDDGLGADLYTSIGGGHLWLGPHTEFFGFVGGGLLLHTKLDWLAIRFDLKGYFFRLRNSSGGDFNSDMSLAIGPSILF